MDCHMPGFLCPSLSPRVCSDSCPLSQWCHPTISSSVTTFFSCPQSFPASGSFPVSQLFTSGGQSIRVSVSASLVQCKVNFKMRLTWLAKEMFSHVETWNPSCGGFIAPTKSLSWICPWTFLFVSSLYSFICKASFNSLSYLWRVVDLSLFL